MSHRLLTSMGGLPLVIAAALLAPLPVAGETWTVPRTADGQPDLQGGWDFRTIRFGADWPRLSAVSKVSKVRHSEPSVPRGRPVVKAIFGDPRFFGINQINSITPLGFVSPCIFIHSNELIPTRCSN